MTLVDSKALAKRVKQKRIVQVEKCAYLGQDCDMCLDVFYCLHPNLPAHPEDTGRYEQCTFVCQGYCPFEFRPEETQ